MAAMLAAIGTAAAVAGETGAASAIPAAAGIGAGALGAGAAGAATGLGLASEAAIGAGTGSALVAPPSVAALGPAAGFVSNTGPAADFISQANPGTPSFFEPPPAAAPGGLTDFASMTKNDMLMQMLQGIMKSAKGPAAPPVADMPGGNAPVARPQTAAMQALARFKPFPRLTLGGGMGGGGGADPTTALLMRLLRGA